MSSEPSPSPDSFSPQERTKEIREYLANLHLQHQRANYMELIEMYKSGELKDLSGATDIWLCEDKVIKDFEDATYGTAVYTVVDFFPTSCGSTSIASSSQQSGFVFPTGTIATVPGIRTA